MKASAASTRRDEVAADRRPVEVDDGRIDVPDVEGDGEPEQDDQDRRLADGQEEAPRIAADVEDLLAGDRPDAAHHGRLRSFDGPDEDVLERRLGPPGDPLLELAGRAQGDDLAGIDDRQAVAALDLVHVVRGDERRRPAGRSA